MDAEHPEEIFTLLLEETLAGVANALLQRKLGGIDLDPTTGLRGEEWLQACL
ncbi:hypothetical protein G3480_21805 [Thiorhodococcus mannitoliphagus]|uniref:Uncharacterized protein n=1 Tax=Thiorhodococcus mannitoliphagus TaxID=329406 RepID=A0A6P1E4F5_9GAMM|nr:hypothetical protein [Thiorhodococcus mannitoliphagus]